MYAPARTFETLVSGYSFFEGPRWRDGRLWLSDFYTNQVLAIGLDGTIEKIADVPHQPSGLGWLPDGTLLIVSMLDRRVLRLEGTELVEHADLSSMVASHLNDMLVDTEGRAYVGGFGADVLHGEPIKPTVLVRVDPNGSAHVVAEDLFLPNGIVITAGGTLVVAETLGNRLTAFDIRDDGTLENSRPWILFGERLTTTDLTEAIPQLVYAADGMTTDAEGGIWFADVFGQRAVRAVAGQIVDQISTSEQGVGTFSLTLGGPDGRTLFLCSAPSFSEEACRADHQARILMTTVDVPHAGQP